MTDREFFISLISDHIATLEESQAATTPSTTSWPSSRSNTMEYDIIITVDSNKVIVGISHISQKGIKFLKDAFGPLTAVADLAKKTLDDVMVCGHDCNIRVNVA